MTLLPHISLLGFVLAFLLVLVGYWASVAITAWSWRATLFLTGLIVSVLGHSLIGVIATAPPAIVCVFYFEREQLRRRQRSRYSRNRMRRFAGFQVEKWDGETPVVVFDKNQYLSSEDEIRDYLISVPPGDEVRLCPTAPIFLNTVRVEDLTYGPSIPLEEPIQSALNHLNELIERSTPISWEQRAGAIDLEDLKARLLGKKTGMP